jgi:hypothetical protein
MSNNNGNPNQLFDLVQRPVDGVWTVWTRKSPLELGMVDREEIEAARMQSFTDEQWADFLTQAHVTDASVWVIAATYAQRPTVDTVLALLGVKRRPRPEGAARPANKPSQPRRPRPDAVKAA